MDTIQAGALLATIVHGLLLAAILLVFPAIALRLWRRQGTQGLVRAVAGSILLIGLIAIMLSSELLGNRLSGTYGFSHIAQRALLLYEVTLGVPVVVAACVIRAWAPAGRFLLPYSIAVFVAGVAWAGAAIASAYLLPALG